MEGNKDEALKCLNLAEKLLHSGHREKGIKFLKKSIKLYSTKKAEELLHTFETNGSSCNGATPEDGEGSHTRRRTRTKSSSKEQENVQKEYTPEQVEEVSRLKKCKDYYEVLGIDRDDVDEGKLKKNYRKLALKFHPDKNSAPGADEAFKRIGNAFAVLSDEDKRRKYDRYGEDLGPQMQRSHRHYHEDEFSGDISPEDLFNMFFGGGYPSGRVYMHRQNGRQAGFQQQHHQQQNVTSLYPLLQVVPILLIVLFSMLSSFLIPEPVFSFHQTSQYRYPMTTSRLGITYYVKDRELGDKYDERQLNELERQIDREFVENLQIKCYREKQYQAELYQQARIWGNNDLFKRAQAVRMDSCNRLQQLSSRG